MKTVLLATLLLVAALISIGCDSGCCKGNELRETTIVTRGNQLPRPVIIGLPQEIPCNTSIVVDGRQSSDDGQIVSYEWTLDGEILDDSTTTPTVTLLCDGAIHTLCLTVTDNEGASQTTCQQMTVQEKIPVSGLEEDSELKIPTPVITYEKVNSNEYKFYCKESHDNDTIDSDGIDNSETNDIVNCKWSALKYQQDGYIESHTLEGSVKWVNVNPQKFKALDLTLTVTDDDNQTATITKHYILAPAFAEQE